jgi:hypothetical protein
MSPFTTLFIIIWICKQTNSWLLLLLYHVASENHKEANWISLCPISKQIFKQDVAIIFPNNQLEVALESCSLVVNIECSAAKFVL